MVSIAYLRERIRVCKLMPIDRPGMQLTYCCAKKH